MPKESVGLYTHRSRPVVSRTYQYDIPSPSSTGRLVANTRTNFLPPPDPEEVEYVPMDLDIDDEPSNEQLTPSEPTEDSEEGTMEQSSGVKLRVKAKRYDNSDAPLTTWINYRDEYLEEVMGLEGQGSFAKRCSGCSYSFPEFRCKDCTHGPVWCQQCIVAQHQHSPLHMVQKWNGLFYQRCTLKELGLRIQLGHAPGRFCPTALAANKDFHVMHTNGIHNVAINYCRCVDVPYHIQLLRIGWWPATPKVPKTCGTFTMLQQFHILNLQGKITGFSYYRGLEYLTDNTGLNKPPDRLSSFMLMVKEYRHTKMLKQAGRAYDPDGVSATQPGSLAIPCRACPLPNINLPPDWQNVPPFRAWLYTLIVAMDANFRLKSKLRGGLGKSPQEPALGLGWSYFVDNGPYSDFIKDYVQQDEISTCVGFQAILNMLTKRSKGLRATGLAAVSCARHQMFRALGMGDLQKGERQCNMDYLLSSAIQGFRCHRLMISYDVGCQWFTNFWTRNQFLPPHLKINLPFDTIRALVPKFHLQSHEEKCHGPFSFNYHKGCGRTDGEGVERNWDELNPQGPSTSEMTPGHRWLTLDVCCGWVNFRKTMGLGNLLLKRLLEAIPKAKECRADFKAFDEALRAEIPDEVVAAEQAINAWDADHTLPDPYLVPKSKITLQEVRLMMAEEEKKQVEEGTSVTREVGESAAIVMGMEIQNTQQALQVEVKGLRKQTLLQRSSLVERRTALLKRVQRFREVQKIHMPGLEPITYIPPSTTSSSTPTSTSSQVENFTLWLPSELTALERRKYCTASLIEVEDRLRFAEATDSLESLRHHLRTRSFANRWKIANVTGQIHNTRAREQQARIDDKVKAAELQYNRARKALMALRGPGEWSEKLQALQPSDVRALNERELTAQEKEDIRRMRIKAGRPVETVDDERASVAGAVVGDGQRKPSWIWYTGNVAEDIKDPMTRAALRVEWAKTRARADRWEEEVVLLDEEMRRVLLFCIWRAAWWRRQPDQRALDLEDHPYLLRGLNAYAAKQAAQEDTILQNWSAKWRAARAKAVPIINSVFPDEARSPVAGAADEDAADEDAADEDVDNDEVTELELELYGEDEYNFDEYN